MLDKLPEWMQQSVLRSQLPAWMQDGPPPKKQNHGPLAAFDFVNQRLKSLPGALVSKVEAMAHEAVAHPRTFTMGLVGTGELGAAAPERIVSAAIKAPDGRIFNGVNHAEAFDALGATGDKVDAMHAEWGRRSPSYKPYLSEGYVTSTGRYVDRKEGLAIAKAAKQTTEKGDRGVAEMMNLQPGQSFPKPTVEELPAKLVAKLLEPGGATLTRTGAPFKGTGYLVADPALTVVAKTPEEVAAFVKRADVRAALKAGGHFGKWTDPQTGISEINISHPFASKADALAVAAPRKEKAIGHIINGEYQGDIPVPQKPAVPPKVGQAAIRFYIPGEKEPRTFTGRAHPFARMDAEDQLGDLLDENFEPRFKEEEGFLADDGKTFMTRQEALESAKYHKQLGGSQKNLENVKRSGQLKAEALKQPDAYGAATDQPLYSEDLKGRPSDFVDTRNAFTNILKPSQPVRAVAQPPSIAELEAKLERVKKRLTTANGEQADQLKQDQGDLEAMLNKLRPQQSSSSLIPPQEAIKYYVGLRTPEAAMQKARELAYRAFRPKGPYGKIAAKGEKVSGAPDWYDTRRAIQEAAAANPKTGADQMNEIFNMMAGSTARSNPRNNLQRGIMWSTLNQRGLLDPEQLRSNELYPVPPKFGHFAQRKMHQKGVADVVEHGGLNPKTNPKPTSFGGRGPNGTGNLGLNWLNPTLDDVMSRIAVELEPRLQEFFTGTPESAMAPKNQFYGPLAEGFRDAADEALKLGRVPLPDDKLAPAAAYQAMGWMGKSPSASKGSLYDIFSKLRDESAAMWGVSPDEANSLLFNEQRPFLLPLGYPLGRR